MSILGYSLSLSDSNTIILPNQVISLSSGNIVLSNSGGSISLNSLLSSDSPNLLSIGADSKIKASVSIDSTLAGNGTAGNPLKIAQQGAGTGHILTWNGTSWAPAAPSGLPAGGLGDLIY